MKQRIKYRGNGQSILEYALPTLLLGSFLFLSFGNPRAWFLSLLEQSVHGKVVQNVLVIKSQGTYQNQSSSSVNSSTTNPLLGSNTNASYSSFTATPTATVPFTGETVGSLGNAANIYANVKVIEQLFNSLKLSSAAPDLIGLISNLANEGHAIGDQISTGVSNNAVGNLLLDKTNLLSDRLQNITDYTNFHPGALSPEQMDILENATQSISGDGVSAANGMITEPSLVHSKSNTICNTGGSNCITDSNGNPI